MGESRRFSTRPSTGFVNCLKPAGCAELQGLDQDDLIWLLSYRPGAEEAGPEKSFDLSEVAMAQRWRAGFLDMQHAAGLAPDKNGICSVRRR